MKLPGIHTISWDRTITIGGEERTYSQHMPRYSAQRNGKLVLAFHGGHGTSERFMEQTQLINLAQQGFTVIAPQAVDGMWNVGDGRYDTDDLGFIDAVVERTRLTKVYATGLSRGGMMAYKLACHRDVEAIAAVASTMMCDCPNVSGTGLLHIHGSEDQHIPYFGGVGEDTQEGLVYPPVSDGIYTFIIQNDGAATGQNKPQRVDDHVFYSVDCPSGKRVELVYIDEHGHAWPGSEPSFLQRLKGMYVCQHFDATSYISQFFTEN